MTDVTLLIQWMMELAQANKILARFGDVIAGHPICHYIFPSPSPSAFGLLPHSQQFLRLPITSRISIYPHPSMGKLWGSSPPDDDGGSSSRPDTQPQERREPDERSSLLPQETHHHLDPGDPAVSPYNLLSVRSLRWISIFLLFVSVLWWLMIFVATFVSPPGFHTRGGGWFAFA